MKSAVSSTIYTSAALFGACVIGTLFISKATWIDRKIDLRAPNWSSLAQVEFKLSQPVFAAPAWAAELDLSHARLAKLGRFKPQKIARALAQDSVRVSQAQIDVQAPRLDIKQEKQRLLSMHSLLRRQFLVAAVDSGSVSTQLANLGGSETSSAISDNIAPHTAVVSPVQVKAASVQTNSPASNPSKTTNLRSKSSPAVQKVRTEILASSQKSLSSATLAQAKTPGHRIEKIETSSDRRLSTPKKATEHILGTALKGREREADWSMDRLPPVAKTRSLEPSSKFADRLAETKPTHIVSTQSDHRQKPRTLSSGPSLNAIESAFMASQRPASLAKSDKHLTGAMTTQKGGANQEYSFGPLLAQMSSLNSQRRSDATGGYAAVTVHQRGGALATAPGSSSAPAVTSKDVERAKQLAALVHSMGPVQRVEKARGQDAQAVEAFEWKSEISHAVTQVLSEEGMSGTASGKWLLTRADGYLRSISWSSGNLGSESRISAALISKNTLLMLGRLTGLPIQKDLGIVFGRVPAGWSVRLSEHLAAQANYLEHADGSRDFVWVNVTPGVHQLFVEKSGSTRPGSIALPVLAGGSTFLDIPAPNSRKISGRIYDAGSENSGIASIEVSVVGQNIQTVTDETGQFTLNDVTTVGDVPIYLSVDAKGQRGFTHRYRIRPESESKFAALFWFSPEKVQEWANQLEGGLSGESGLAISAVPSLASHQENSQLYPAVTPVVRRSDEEPLPETYVLGAHDQLLVKQPLEVGSPRFLAVEIPEGAAIAEVENANKTLIWSQLFFASRNVINVIGPNP